MAVASGSIRWAKAELVRERDEFVMNGLDKLPTHNFNPFAKDRGEIVGVYCVAKTADGDYLTDTMGIEEVNDIRDRSTAWKAWIAKQKKCPWVTDYGEMVRKTIIKRASKYWPKTDRLDAAIHNLNTDGEEGLAVENDAQVERATFDQVTWLERASKADSIEALQAVWTAGVKAAEIAKDRPGYAVLKQAIIARKAELEGVENV